MQSMRYIKYLLIILFFATAQSAWALDEGAMRSQFMQELERSGPSKGVEFNLCSTLNDKRAEEPLLTQYFGYQANPEKITDKTEILTGANESDVRLTRRRDLDSHGLACFDTLSANGTLGRMWVDFGSEKKIQFPKCYMYKTWGILSMTAD